MKKLFLLCLVSLCAFQASAQYYGHSGYGNRFNRGSSGEYLSTGYRGMVELGNGFGWGDYEYVVKFTTTHGYQFNPYFYLGAFVSFGTAEVWYEEDYWNYDYDPFFNFRCGADARVYMSKGRVAPFAGLQLGLDTYGGPRPDCCAYVSGQLGLRFALKNKLALNCAAQVGSGWWFEVGEVIFKVGFEF